MKDAVWDCSYGCYIYFQIRFNFVDSTIAIHIKRTLVVLAQNGLPDSEVTYILVLHVHMHVYQIELVKKDVCIMSLG